MKTLLFYKNKVLTKYGFKNIFTATKNNIPLIVINNLNADKVIDELINKIIRQNKNATPEVLSKKIDNFQNKLRVFQF